MDAVTTVGLVLLATAVVGGGLKLLGAELPVLSSVSRQVVVGVVGGALLLVGLYLPDDKPGLPRELTTGRILSPQNRPVAQVEMASGVVANLPSDHKVFLLLEIGRYYPQGGGAVRVLPDGTWSAQVRLGQSEEPGPEFRLHLVDGGPVTVTALTRYFEQADQTRRFPGIPIVEAPPDMRTLDSVKLVRG